MRNLPHIFLVIVFLISGCRGSSSVSPLPGNLQSASVKPRSDSRGSRQLLGYWQCVLDKATGQVTAAPSREAMVHLNVVASLNKTLGMGIQLDKTQSKPSEGLFVLTVSLTHPYKGSPTLAAFDVRGIVITTAGLTAGVFNLAGPNDPYMLEPDGFTRWWNPVEFTTPGFFGYTPGVYGKNPPAGIPLVSMINPYKQFADGLYKTSPGKYVIFIPPGDPNFRGVFRAGATNSRVYKLKFPVESGSPKVYFNYAVDASYHAPSKEKPLIPDDFPIEANCPEAFVVEAKVTGNTLFAIDGAPIGGGELKLEIECYDWQGWLGSYNGQIGPLVLISPFSEFQSVQPDVKTFPNGKAVLSATIPGAPVKTGTIPVWVGVTAPGTSYKQNVQPAPSEPVVAYTLINVEVALAECTNNNNNDCTTALTIGPIDHVQGYLCKNVDNSDWFNFKVPAGSLASGPIHLSTYGVANLDLFLYEGCPVNPIEGSAHSDFSDEDIVLNELPAGSYYIEVRCGNDSSLLPRPYELKTNISIPGSECTLDTNNNYQNAEKIGLDEMKNGSVCAFGDPADWYTFKISQSATASGSVNLTNKSAGNIDIFIYNNPTGSPIFSGEKPGTSNELITINLIDSGTYFIKVEAIGNSPTGDRAFTLDMNLVEIVDECDSADGNNTFETAESIELNGEKTGTVCYPTDPDWYVFEVSGTNVDGNIILESPDSVDNDLAVYGSPPDVPLYDSSTPGTGDELIKISNLAPGTYFIKISASSEASGVNQNYSLSTSLHPHEEGPTDFYLHVFIVRANDGSSPATNEARVNANVAWADQFWQKWADGSATASKISYINRTQWLSLTTSEAETMFNQFGDKSGVLNVFYVNDTPDMPGAAAYTWMECEFKLQTSLVSYIIMTDLADNATLAHEMGHAVALLGDMYLLDFYSCEQITYCPSGPSGIFCLEQDAVLGNIMYWPVGEDINAYWASDMDKGMSTYKIDSQIENMIFFNTFYPDAFKTP